MKTLGYISLNLIKLNSYNCFSQRRVKVLTEVSLGNLLSVFIIYQQYFAKSLENSRHNRGKLIHRKALIHITSSPEEVWSPSLLALLLSDLMQSRSTLESLLLSIMKYNKNLFEQSRKNCHDTGNNTMVLITPSW